MNKEEQIKDLNNQLEVLDDKVKLVNKAEGYIDDVRVVKTYLASEEENKNFLINELNIDSSDVNYIYYRIRLQHILCDPNKSIPSLDDDELISWLEKYLISQSYSTEEITVILNDISINKEKSSYIKVVILI